MCIKSEIENVLVYKLCIKQISDCVWKCVRPAFNTFCPSFLCLQMHHPIQMKPADSEKSNGE